MAHPDSHAVRNGTIATVTGGILLAALSSVWPPLKSALVWCWAIVKLFSSYLTGSYLVPGWVLVLISLLALVTLVTLAVELLRSKAIAPHAGYVEDNFYGATWRWTWSNSDIEGLWCFCPRCDSELVYNDMDYARTNFLCEHCNNKVVSSVGGGDRGYALDSVKRQIRRKIRTNQFPGSPQQG